MAPKVFADIRVTNFERHLIVGKGHWEQPLLQTVQICQFVVDHHMKDIIKRYIYHEITAALRIFTTKFGIFAAKLLRNLAFQLIAVPQNLGIFTAINMLPCIGAIWHPIKYSPLICALAMQGEQGLTLRHRIPSLRSNCSNLLSGDWHKYAIFISAPESRRDFVFRLK